MKSLKTTVAVLIVLSLASCGKEMSFEEFTAGNNLLGNWDFVEMRVKGTSDVTLTDGTDTERAVTFNEYVTTDNTGTLTINSKQFVSTDIGYSVSTVSRMESYSNGVSNGSIDQPFDFTPPKTSSAADYKLISEDSVYMNSGALNGLPGTTSTIAGGMKYRIKEDSLFLTTNVNLVETGPMPGYPTLTVTTKTNAQTINVFKKQ